MDSVAAFNGLPDGRLRDELLSCCAAPTWGEAITGGRPYPDRNALEAAAQAAADSLSWADVLEGLSAHPRIGERAAGDSREAVWSRQEQSAAQSAAQGKAQGAAQNAAQGAAQNAGQGAAASDGKAALIAANRDYEERFGHVFLIFASGKSQGEILAAARGRLGNDEVTERAVVRGELGKIALLRLGRLLDALG